MTAYATLDDAIDLYGDDYVNTSVRLTQDATPVPDVDTLCVAFRSSSSEIDSYLAERYTTPITPVPDVLKKYCIDMAIYSTSSDAGTGTDEKRRRYDDAIRWLKDIAKGVAGLVTSEEDAPADQNPVLVGPSRLFSRSSMRRL